MIITVILACLLSLVVTAIVSVLEAFPVAGILYVIVTILLDVVSFPFWTWYVICAGALFLFNLLFNKNEIKK